MADPVPRIPETVDDLPLRIRAQNSLKRAGIKTTSQLVGHTALDLLDIRQLGRTQLREIQDALHGYGLSLKG